ncbi:NACHT domain-containing protein [Gulbenkiania mobilis]|uniref:NACHT domain-containing protein n=1 Tax=Gulbenkiania mobilis TaxID=397457 RepID=A0ABY2CWU4_GULMO|nr:NACHT domain-containing protein [Gulbenkiania mobilis]
MSKNEFDTAFALASALEHQLLQLAPDAQAFTHHHELWVFVSRPQITSPDGLKAAADILGAPLPPDVFAVHYVLIHWDPRSHLQTNKSSDDLEQVSLQLGKSAVTKAFALRRLLDLPATFEKSQQALIDEALSPLALLHAQPIAMRLIDNEGESYSNAAEKLSKLIDDSATMGSGLVFIEAEAGRGKTILLASQAQKMREQWNGKLPIYIPLRKLPLESGVAWESITQLIGIVGEGSERLIRAVKSGLVTLFLDGIDEVSGRYDKNLIRDLLELMTGRLRSTESAVVLSGRKTEARHLSPQEWAIFSVELPNLETDDFRTYVGSVVDGVVRQRAEPVEIPEEYVDLVGERLVDDQVKRERDDIVQWIIEVLPELAQEPSLFFVQGLAAIAIGRRAGNRAPLRSPEGKLDVPPVWDVCLIAALYACLRECTKIDIVAKANYSVEGQMLVLQGLAAIASAPSLANIPTPYELIPDAFGVDPVNAPEVNVAIVRQNAKHALLYATEAAGAYRPQFLSDWIRCSLLAQIFKSCPPVGKLNRAEVLKLAASATRAKYTFELLLPSMLEDELVHAEWLDALNAAVADKIEAASANQWSLRAAVGDERLGAPVQNPLPLAEITDEEFVGFTIGEEFSGSDFMLDGSLFVNSSIACARLNGVSMRGVVFTNCEVSKLELIDCEGPITFEACTLSDVVITNIQSKFKPALQFRNCSFLGTGNVISQFKPAFSENEYEVVATFQSCFTEGEIQNLLRGDWAGNDQPLIGITHKEKAPLISRGEACLRRALRAFFPSHIGAGSALQARKYIRLSALGRGSMPPGSPGQEQLQQIFESVGFSTGGRSDHLYGPWSGVAGASSAGMALRNELVDFLLDSSNQGKTVQLLIQKLEAHF